MHIEAKPNLEGVRIKILRNVINLYTAPAKSGGIRIKLLRNLNNVPTDPDSEDAEGIDIKTTQKSS